MAMKKLYRSRNDRVFLGICGGLAQYFEIDPALIRLITILVCVFTGLIPLILVYAIAAMLIPLHSKAIIFPHYRKLTRSRSDRKIGGICGGLGQFFRVDPTLLRLGLVFLCLLTGIVPLTLAYLVGWVIIPEA